MGMESTEEPFSGRYDAFLFPMLISDVNANGFSAFCGWLYGIAAAFCDDASFCYERCFY